MKGFCLGLKKKAQFNIFDGNICDLIVTRFHKGKGKMSRKGLIYLVTRVHTILGERTVGFMDLLDSVVFASLRGNK